MCLKTLQKSLINLPKILTASTRQTMVGYGGRILCRTKKHYKQNAASVDKKAPEIGKQEHMTIYFSDCAIMFINK